MYYIALTTSFALTFVALFGLRRVADQVGLVDVPGGRKTHEVATPMVGGIGIFCGVLLATMLMPGLLAEFAPLLSLASLVLLIGIIDDARNLSANLRMAAHVLLAISMAVVANVRLESLGALLGPDAIALGALAIPVTVFATVGVINAINMSDGIDGLSGGMVLVVLALISIAATIAGFYGTALFTAILSSALIAFLTLNYRHPWNRRAVVYMGDAGSTTLGFVLAWLLIESSQGQDAVFSPVFALWFLAVPLMDTVNLLIKRPLRGVSPFNAGHDHLHHQLLRRGLTVQQTVMIMMGAAMLLGGFGLFGWITGISESTMFLLFLALFGVYFSIADRIAPTCSPASSS